MITINYVYLDQYSDDDFQHLIHIPDSNENLRNDNLFSCFFPSV